MALVYQAGYHEAKWKQKSTRHFTLFSVHYDIIISDYSFIVYVKNVSIFCRKIAPVMVHHIRILFF